MINIIKIVQIDRIRGDCYNFEGNVVKGIVNLKAIRSKEKQSTRDVILDSLKSTSEQKVDELAVVADVSPVTVRHHLNSLTAEGLVEKESVRRKVGRPYYVYSLTKQGHELFPKRYVSLTNRLLAEMKNQLPPDMIKGLFSAVVSDIIEEHRQQFEGRPFEERLAFLVELLEQEGFLARWEKDGNGRYLLTEYSCPYLSVGSEHQEVCAFDKELMINVLQTPVQQHSCMLNGADCCQFTIQPDMQEQTAVGHA